MIPRKIKTGKYIFVAFEGAKLMGNYIEQQAVKMELMILVFKNRKLSFPVKYI